MTWWLAIACGRCGVTEGVSRIVARVRRSRTAVATLPFVPHSLLPRGFTPRPASIKATTIRSP
eukprot:6153281-Prymnesium_polylepis.1